MQIVLAPSLPICMDMYDYLRYAVPCPPARHCAALIQSTDTSPITATDEDAVIQYLSSCPVCAPSSFQQRRPKGENQCP